MLIQRWGMQRAEIVKIGAKQYIRIVSFQDLLQVPLVTKAYADRFNNQYVT